MRARVGVVGLAIAHVALADTPHERADRLFDQGRALIDAHDDVGACAKFKAAIALDPDAAGTMLNLGLCNEDLGKLGTALYWFRKAQVRAHETNLPLYEDAAGQHTMALASKVAVLRIGLAGPGGTTVAVDGAPVRGEDFERVELDPGRHTIDARATGFIDVHREFSMTNGSASVVHIEMKPGATIEVRDPSAQRRRVGLYVGIGAVALLAASGAVTLYAVHGYDRCTPGGVDNGACADATTEAIHYRNIERWGATPPFAGGIVAGAIAAYLYFRAPGVEHIDHTISPDIAADHAGVSFSGRF